MTLDHIGKHRIRQLQSMLKLNELKPLDHITLDNDNRSIIQVIDTEAKSTYETYSPYETFYYLQDNDLLEDIK